MPPRGSVGTGARHPPLPSYVEGEGARARWEGTGGRLTAHAGPAHPPESPHVRSGPTSRGRESEEEAERAGLALPLAAEVCSRLLVPSELEARAAGAGARAQWAGGGGVLGPWTREGRERGGGRAQARERARCCQCHSVSSVLAASWGKVFGWIVVGTPLPAGHLRRATPARPRSRPARCPPALPRPAGRARRGADYISPGLAGLVFPEPRLPEPGAPGGERRPSPAPAGPGKVTSRGSHSPGTRRAIPTPSRRLQPLPGPCSRTPPPPFPVSSLGGEVPATPCSGTPPCWEDPSEAPESREGTVTATSRGAGAIRVLCPH